MAPATDNQSEDLKKAGLNVKSFQHDIDRPVRPSPVGAPHLNLDANEIASSNIHESTSSQGEADAAKPTTGSSELASSPIPLDDHASDKDLGAFDDTHLQVDQAKKKKKKKRSKKPKSKRGLVLLSC
jgi:hypothetical protein